MTASAQDRFTELKPEQMTPEQKNVAEAIMSGPRKRLAGPFNAWLRSPVIADRLQKVGEYLRFNSSLPPRLNEFAILITARAWNAQYEWYAHHILAMKAGLDPKVAEELAEGKRPSTMQPDEAIIYDFSTQLRRNKQVDDATYKAMLDKFGEQGIVDLIAVNGYYDTVSMTLNVARVPVPPGTPLPLKPLDKPFP
jgi:4-carboxymuconolactone decarboxylase